MSAARRLHALLLVGIAVASLCGCASEGQPLTVVVENRLGIPLDGLALSPSSGRPVSLASIPVGGSTTVRLPVEGESRHGGKLRLLDGQRGGTYVIKQGYFGSLTGTVTIVVDRLSDKGRLDGPISSQTNHAPGQRRICD